METLIGRFEGVNQITVAFLQPSAVCDNNLFFARQKPH